MTPCDPAYSHRRQQHFRGVRAASAALLTTPASTLAPHPLSQRSHRERLLRSPTTKSAFPRPCSGWKRRPHWKSKPYVATQGGQLSGWTNYQTPDPATGTELDRHGGIYLTHDCSPRLCRKASPRGLMPLPPARLRGLCRPQPPVFPLWGAVLACVLSRCPRGMDGS